MKDEPEWEDYCISEAEARATARAGREVKRELDSECTKAGTETDSSNKQKDKPIEFHDLTKKTVPNEIEENIKKEVENVELEAGSWLQQWVGLYGDAEGKDKEQLNADRSEKDLELNRSKPISQKTNTVPVCPMTANGVRTGSAIFNEAVPHKITSIAKKPLVIKKSQHPLMVTEQFPTDIVAKDKPQPLNVLTQKLLIQPHLIAKPFTPPFVVVNTLAVVNVANLPAVNCKPFKKPLVSQPESKRESQPLVLTSLARPPVVSRTKQPIMVAKSVQPVSVQKAGFILKGDLPPSNGELSGSVAVPSSLTHTQSTSIPNSTLPVIAQTARSSVLKAIKRPQLPNHAIESSIAKRISKQGGHRAPDHTIRQSFLKLRRCFSFQPIAPKLKRDTSKPSAAHHVQDNPKTYSATTQNKKTAINYKPQSPISELEAFKPCYVILERMAVLSCDICKKTFHERKHLIDHIAYHSADSSNSVNEHSDVKSLIAKHPNLACKVCGKMFKYKMTLVRHIRRHLGVQSYVCDACGKGFVDKRNLINHVRTHTGDKPYSCDVCNKRCRTASNLQSHKLLHNKKQYTCPVCEKIFRHKPNLRRHTKLHASSEPKRPFSCDVCKKRFGSKNHVQRHMSIHTGEKPYSCKLCKRKFRLTQTLVVHERTHARGLSCDTCWKL